MHERTHLPGEPWRAVFLNSILPGLGEFSAGMPLRGAAFLAGAIGLAAALAARLYAFIFVPAAATGVRAIATLAALAGALFLLVVGSFVDAYSGVKRRNRERGLAIPPDRRKAPWLSATLSRFVPGLGQLYNGRYAAAGLHAGIWLLLLFFLHASWLFAAAGVLAVLSMASAYRDASRINGGAETFRGAFGPLPRAAVAAVIVAGCLPLPALTGPHLFRVHRIAGGAMRPGLLPNDRIIVDTALYRLGGIRRGDVALFKAPDRPGQYYTKRIVGMPGETIEIREGKIIIDGEPLVTGGVIDRIPYRNYGTCCLPGETVRIPEGRYFFLGDRIENSLDSRFYGPIPLGEFGGRAVKIVRPRRRAGPVL
ncbi:MAG: signal peptidase I [bacterium]|nr:signal peptidase I [bacterium]